MDNFFTLAEIIIKNYFDLAVQLVDSMEEDLQRGGKFTWVQESAAEEFVNMFYAEKKKNEEKEQTN